MARRRKHIRTPLGVRTKKQPPRAALRGQMVKETEPTPIVAKRAKRPPRCPLCKRDQREPFVGKTGLCGHCAREVLGIGAENGAQA